MQYPCLVAKREDTRQSIEGNRLLACGLLLDWWVSTCVYYHMETLTTYLGFIAVSRWLLCSRIGARTVSPPLVKFTLV